MVEGYIRRDQANDGEEDDKKKRPHRDSVADRPTAERRSCRALSYTGMVGVSVGGKLACELVVEDRERREGLSVLKQSACGLHLMLTVFSIAVNYL
jgi:hypothetical protein